MSDHAKEPQPDGQTDASEETCAMIARCHRRQYPTDYGVPYVANAGHTVEELLAIAELTVDRGPMDGE